MSHTPKEKWHFPKADTIDNLVFSETGVIGYVPYSRKRSGVSRKLIQLTIPFFQNQSGQGPIGTAIISNAVSVYEAAAGFIRMAPAGSRHQKSLRNLRQLFHRERYSSEYGC